MEPEVLGGGYDCGPLNNVSLLEGVANQRDRRGGECSGEEEMRMLVGWAVQEEGGEGEDVVWVLAG